MVLIKKKSTALIQHIRTLLLLPAMLDVVQSHVAKENV